VRFYLTTHEPSWLSRPEIAGDTSWGIEGTPPSAGDVPLFVSRHRLSRLKRLRPAVAPWVLDSGGFTELSPHFGGPGYWRIDADEYIDEVLRYREEIGWLEWAAPMDWMCEPEVVEHATAPSARGWEMREAIALHQRRTTANYLELRQLAPEVPWAPVLQGWHMADYEEHVRVYEENGVDLTDPDLPAVGVGSVCRRSDDPGTGDLFLRLDLMFRELRRHGIENLHAFGYKTEGLLTTGGVLASADSLAWSYDARQAANAMRRLGYDGGVLPGHYDPGFRDPVTGRLIRHTSCSNCIVYALLWRTNLLWRLREAYGYWEQLADLTTVPIAPWHAGEVLESAPAGPVPAPSSLVVPIDKRRGVELGRPSRTPETESATARPAPLEQLKLF